jgi:hypothetical protein
MEGNARDNQSFRTWLINSLDLVATEFVSETQSRTVSAGNDVAHFSVRSHVQLTNSGSLLLDHELFEDDFESGPDPLANEFSLVASAEGQVKFVFPAVAGGEGKEHFGAEKEHAEGDHDRPALDFVESDLLESLPAQPIELPSAWQGMIRVTPRNKRLVISATAMGTYFHALMENLPADGRPFNREEIEDLVFAQHDLIPTAENIAYFVNEGERLMQLFYTSDLCRLFKQAKRRLHELPYVIQDGVLTLSRRPDLLIENADGRWQLVDFKTDHFEVQEIKKQTKRHSKQLHEYVSVLGALLKVRMTPHIYYAQHALLVDCRV